MAAAPSPPSPVELKIYLYELPSHIAYPVEEQLGEPREELGGGDYAAYMLVGRSRVVLARIACSAWCARLCGRCVATRSAAKRWREVGTVADICSLSCSSWSSF